MLLETTRCSGKRTIALQSKWITIVTVELAHTIPSLSSAQARAEAEAPSKARKGKKGKRKLTEEDAYHYVSYIYLDGYIWELDGMNKFPCKVAPAESSSWIDTLRPYLRQRME